MRASSFRRAAITVSIHILMLECASVLHSQPQAFGVRGGVGTDLQLGLGFGAGAAYVWNSSGGGTTRDQAA